MSGIECPRCGCRDMRDEQGRPWKITDTREGAGYIRRRRICRYCRRVVYTREQIEKEEDHGSQEESST